MGNLADVGDAALFRLLVIHVVGDGAGEAVAGLILHRKCEKSPEIMISGDILCAEDAGFDEIKVVI